MQAVSGSVVTCVRRTALAAMGLLAAAAIACLVAGRPLALRAAAPPDALDPAAWGADHISEELPEYMEGGECLFCHRREVGRSWQTDRHSRTIRDVEPEHPAVKLLAADPAGKAVIGEVTLLLGAGQQMCFLRRGERYGHCDLLSVRANSTRGGRWRLTQNEQATWDAAAFNQGCAGCHATAVATENQAFSAVGHDCFVCHGAATEEHANDPALMTLSKAAKDPPRVVTSICAQCHLRGGKSRSTGLPYANQFVPGDNLFRDFAVDWQQADRAELNPGDRHVWENVRDVVLLGREETTCLSCHQVHGNSTQRHAQLPDGPACNVCHDPAQPKTKHLIYEVHSPTCGY
ncbi:MAG: hypothetical protein K1X74_19545 [Pirellulales bacterium]|nr:hypothetical protein [Pirellulales bacterium]